MSLGFFHFRIMAPYIPTPMTELEAVNSMLSLIGESPVASLAEATSVADAQIALAMLRGESRDIQGQGWHWNTEEDYELTPTTEGEITLPDNTLKVDPSSISKDCVFRAGKLWDRKEKTFLFSEGVELDIVFGYEFEELPATARRLIALSAGRKFENRMQGDDGAHQIESADVLAAWADLLEEECEIADYNVIRDSSTVRRISKHYR